MDLFKHVIIIGSAIGLLSACDLHHETFLSPNRMQVQEQYISHEIPAEQLDHAGILGLSHEYSRYGGGPIEISVVYDPRSKANTAMKAGDTLHNILSGLQKNGVKPVSGSILPVKNSGESSTVIVSYMSYNALPPEDCTVMPGIETTNIEADPTYKLGCSVDTLFSRQVARPRDLMGQSRASRVSDGRRAGNMAERYRAGIDNEALTGETASGE